MDCQFQHIRYERSCLFLDAFSCLCVLLCDVVVEAARKKGMCKNTVYVTCLIVSSEKEAVSFPRVFLLFHVCYVMWCKSVYEK